MKFASVTIWAISAAMVVPSQADDLLFHTIINNDKEDPFAACEGFTDLIGAELGGLYHPSPSAISTTTITEQKEGLERRFLRMVWPPRHPPKDDVWPPRKNNTKPVWPPSKNNTKPENPPGWCQAFCKVSYPGTCERVFPQCINHRHRGPEDRQLQRAVPTSFCRIACRGWVVGHCYLAYPQCKGSRRQLEGTDAESPMSLEEEDKEEVGTPFLKPQDPQSPDCVTLQRAVQDKLVELATVVVKDNQACAAALLEQYETQCYRVDAVPSR